MAAPPKFLSIVIQLHKDQHGQVKLNRDLSGSFLIVNGVKQGCFLAPTLFSIFLSMMLKQVIEYLDGDDAVYIRYHHDSSLFNLGRLHAHTKTLEQLFCDLFFADDADPVAHTERALQCVTSRFALSEPSSTFTGVTTSLMLRSLIRQKSPALRPYCRNHSYTGQSMSPEWMAIAYPR